MAEQHYSSAEEAAEAALAFLAPQYAPFGRQPRVYTVEACGLKAVCLPWSHTKQTLAIKRVGDIDSLAGKMALVEARFTDTLWWIEGQQDPGRPGALKWARGLADLGDEYSGLIYQIAGLAAEQEAAPRGK